MKLQSTIPHELLQNLRILLNLLTQRMLYKKRCLINYAPNKPRNHYIFGGKPLEKYGKRYFLVTWEKWMGDVLTNFKRIAKHMILAMNTTYYALRRFTVLLEECAWSLNQRTLWLITPRACWVLRNTNQTLTSITQRALWFLIQRVFSFFFMLTLIIFGIYFAFLPDLLNTVMILKLSLVVSAIIGILKFAFINQTNMRPRLLKIKEYTLRFCLKNTKIHAICRFSERITNKFLDMPNETAQTAIMVISAFILSVSMCFRLFLLAYPNVPGQVYYLFVFFINGIFRSIISLSLLLNSGLWRQLLERAFRNPGVPKGFPGSFQNNGNPGNNPGLDQETSQEKKQREDFEADRTVKRDRWSKINSIASIIGAGGTIIALALNIGEVGKVRNQKQELQGKDEMIAFEKKKNEYSEERVQILEKKNKDYEEHVKFLEKEKKDLYSRVDSLAEKVEKLHKSQEEMQKSKK